jgi:predicted dehydrogenase
LLIHLEHVMKTTPDSPDAPDSGEQHDQAGQGSFPRREFLRGAAIAAAGLTIVPRHVLGGTGYTAPSDTVNIAGVGVGGMGRSNMIALSSQNIVALCDVDWGYVDKGFNKLTQQAGSSGPRNAPPDLTAEQRRRWEEQPTNTAAYIEKHPKAKRYTDFREMLEKQKDIDAVVVATPDHNHAVIASAAMDLGKHVYVQKPLTWSVFEARHLAKKAKAKNLITQMGNQGHSTDDARLINEYIAAGAIGDVREVHIWTNRPLAYWPQGIPRPEAKEITAETPWNVKGTMDRLANAMAGNYPRPQGLEWDLFLGPSSSAIEYHPVYHPFNWRGWADWGCGAIGDMGAHLIDHPFWSLNLGFPTTIETVSTPFNKACFPMATMTFYEFAARGSMPPVKMTWYDGNFKPNKPEELEGEELNGEGGVIYVGSKGKLIHQTYGAKPRLLPKSLHDSAGKPPEKFKRITTSHEMNWINAIKGNAEPSSSFDYAARLTETMLLGVVALKAGTKIHYDAENMRVTNNADANQFLKRDMRKGFELTN